MKHGVTDDLQTRPFDRAAYLPIVLAYSVVWRLIGIAYVAYGALVLLRRETFARHAARFHRKAASRVPWLYPRVWGTSDKEWRVLIVLIGLGLIGLGMMAALNVGLSGPPER